QPAKGVVTVLSAGYPAVSPFSRVLRRHPAREPNDSVSYTRPLSIRISEVKIGCRRQKFINDRDVIVDSRSYTFVIIIVIQRRHLVIRERGIGANILRSGCKAQ